jgi:hypothetical protein
MFGPGKQGLLDGSIDLDTDDVRVMLVKAAYTFDATDKFVADLGAVDNGRSIALGSAAVSATGVFDAADTTLTATDAAASDALVLFKNTGSDATARVIAYLSIASFTPSASQAVAVTWDSGASKLFAWNG